MGMNSMRQHREKMLAEKALKAQQSLDPRQKVVTGWDLASGPDQSVQIPAEVLNQGNVPNVELRMFNHLNILKDMKSIQDRIAKKAEWLPEYLGYIDGCLAVSPAPQNTTLVHLMIWACDVNDFELAVRIAEYVVLNDMVMPEGYRKTIAEANPNATPPTAAMMESDEDLRRRVQLEPESMSAGSEGCYQFWGLSAHGHVKDIAVTTPTAGFVDIYVQSHIDEIAVQSLLTIVDQTLTPSTRRPFTDKVTVKAATPIEWTLNASLVLFPGPDAEVVKQAAEIEIIWPEWTSGNVFLGAESGE